MAMRSQGLSVSLSSRGVREVVKMMSAFPKDVQRRVIRSAVRGAANPIWKTARQIVPTESGSLKKSYGVKRGKDMSQKEKRQQKERRKSGIETVFVGARQGFQRFWPNSAGNLRMRNPVYYAHLVEKGTKFMTGSYPLTRGSQRTGEIRARFIKEARKGIEREAKKSHKKQRAKRLGK